MISLLSRSWSSRFNSLVKIATFNVNGMAAVETLVREVRRLAAA
jgi:hypothetical protein